LIKISDKSGENAKLDYLRNLMVNYLTSDLDVREHMEGAIGTVLQFTPEDISRIESKKAASDYWGLF
jgi:GRIP domain